MKKTGRPGMLMFMDRHFHSLAVVAATLLLGACGTMRSSVVVEPAAGTQYVRPAVSSAAAPARTPIPGGSYVVSKGDTLYSIAFRKGVDFRDLAQWNGIAAPYTIWPGQQLTLSPQAKRAAAPSIAATPVVTAPATPTAPVFEAVTPATASASGSTTSPAVQGKPPISPIPRVSAAPGASTSTTASAVISTPAEVPVAGVPAASPASVPPPAPAAAGVARVVSGVHWRWPADGHLIGRFKSGDAIPGIEIAGSSGDPVRAAADGVVVYSGSGLVGYGELVIIKHNDSFLSAYGHNRKRLVKEGQRVSGGQQIAEMGSTGTTRNELEFQIRKDGNPVDPLGYLPLR
jgi:lipoprotein NlpD